MRTSDVPRVADRLVQSDEHALLAGFVWGLAMKHGLDLVPETDDDGNYAASVILTLPDDAGASYAGVTVRLIVEPPTAAVPTEFQQRLQAALERGVPWWLAREAVASTMLDEDDRAQTHVVEPPT